MSSKMGLDSIVQIIGPDLHNVMSRKLGTQFNITQVSNYDEVCYSMFGMPWYPASSLRLVEELKIGDWVEVIGPNTTAPDKCEMGKVFKIEEAQETMFGIKYSAEGVYRYLAPSLRKLAPEEIAQHTAQANTFTVKFKYDTSEFEKSLSEIRAVVWQHEIEGRLSAMQEQIDQMKRAFREAVQ